jgi:hypothetical protein
MGVGCARVGEGVGVLAWEPGWQTSEGTLRAEPQCNNYLVWRRRRWYKMPEQNAQYVEQNPEQMGPQLPRAIPPAVKGRTGIRGV